MTIPDYQALMLPLLRVLEDGVPHSVRSVQDALAAELGLTTEERSEKLPSGQRCFDNRVGWARTYLGKAELIATTARGTWRITDRGKEVLAANPTRVDNQLLRSFPEFVAFKKLKGASTKSSIPPRAAIETAMAPRGGEEPALDASQVDVGQGHSKAQWQLARIGRALALDVWIPRSDRQRVYEGHHLGDLSIETLPSFGLGAAQ